MALTHFKIGFEEIGLKNSLRSDFRISNYHQKKVPYKFKYFKNFILKLSNGKDVAKENYVELKNSEIIYPTVNNIKSTGFVFDSVTAIDSDFEGGYYLDDNDIIITRSGTVGITKCWKKAEVNKLIGKQVEAIPSGYLIVAKVNQKELNPLFIEYFLNSKLLSEYFYVFGVGKSQKNIAQGDIKYLPFPVFSLTTQNEIVAKVQPIQNEINKISSKVLLPNEIIDLVFANHFGFDIENADKKKKELIHYASLEDLANEELKFDISLKYRYIFLNYIKNPSNIEWIELGKLVDVKGGKRLPKGQNITEEETDYKYIRVDDLSWSGVFDLENIKYISEENHKAIKNYIAKENDILLTIVGATVGKCGLVPLELDGENITENFARLIIKDKENYLPEYVNYCLQSKTSVYHIDEYKGRGSQGKLALFRIKKIKMPKIGKTQQQEIVDEIKAELDKQELLKQQITTERNKIDKIIEECIMTAQ